MSGLRKVRVLINPRSGVWWSSSALQQTLQQHWDAPGIDLSYQYSKSAEDGHAKTERAVADGVDTILVVGGDGMVNSIGAALVGTSVALGVIPAGSGNGFARHFGIPLSPEKAIADYKDADRIQIDVGTANGRPFFVTCSMAWDAALVRTFEKFPVRGILPYVLAGAYEFMAFEPQPFDVILDGKEKLRYTGPLVFTTANLTQFGGGARVAPRARPDDGLLELVVMNDEDAPKLLANIKRIFDGTVDELPEVKTRSFRQLDVKRRRAGPIQVDGELVDAPAAVSVRVIPKALTVLVPRAGRGGAKGEKARKARAGTG